MSSKKFQVPLRNDASTLLWILFLGGTLSNLSLRMKEILKDNPETKTNEHRLQNRYLGKMKKQTSKQTTTIKPHLHGSQLPSLLRKVRILYPIPEGRSRSHVTGKICVHFTRSKVPIHRQRLMFQDILDHQWSKEAHRLECLRGQSRHDKPHVTIPWKDVRRRTKHMQIVQVPLLPS